MLKFSRGLLLITAIIWTGYGIACAIFPEIIATLTGIGIDHWTAELEVRAWYLTTELCLGIVAFYGWKEPAKYLHLNLLVWMVMFCLLVAFRFVGTWASNSYFALKPGLQYLPDSYHVGTAYLYELPCAVMFTVLWFRRNSISPPE